jgi:hypothetical protein
MELSFDTDQGRAMARKMLISHDLIERMVREAERACDALTHSGWQAPSSKQFRDLLRGWVQLLKPTLKELRTARARLEKEIKEWEETGNKLEGEEGRSWWDKTTGWISDHGHTVLDVAGMVPVIGTAADIVNAGWYLAEGDLKNAALSGLGAIPFAGDAATAAKLTAKYGDEAVALTQQGLKHGDEAADVAKTATKELPDIRNQFNSFSEVKNGKHYTTTQGELGVPGEVMTHRSKSAQSSVSAGTGDDAGHRIGSRFGAPEGVDNLAQQNRFMNQNGTFKQLEDSWERQLKGGSKIEVSVTDVTGAGETRPFMRKVEWTETAPDGTVKHNTLDFANTHTPLSRSKQNIPETITDPNHIAPVIRLDDWRK